MGIEKWSIWLGRSESEIWWLGRNEWGKRWLGRCIIEMCSSETWRETWSRRKSPWVLNRGEGMGVGRKLPFDSVSICKISISNSRRFGAYDLYVCRDKHARWHPHIGGDADVSKEGGAKCRNITRQPNSTVFFICK